MPPAVCPRCFTAGPTADTDMDVRLCPACDRYYFATPPRPGRQIATAMVLCPATILAAVLTASAVLRY